jgi:hypothetical protein
MRTSKRVSKSKPRRRSISRKSLREKMSELISLRERVAQAELAIDVPKTDHPSRARLRRPQ